MTAYTPGSNLYEDWLQTLTDRQFYEHMAGRLPPPQIAEPKPLTMPMILMLGLIAAMLVVACVV